MARTVSPDPEERKNEFGVPDIGIPAEVLFNPHLNPTEKILFGFIRNLSQSSKGCWATNNYLAKIMDVGPQTISNSIKKLEENYYIKTTYRGDYKGGISRNIFINREYPQIYSSMVQKIHDKLQEHILKNLYNPIKIIIEPYKNNYSKEVKEEDIYKDYTHDVKKFIMTWKDLCKKYNKSQVIFVKKFLQRQKAKWPKLIKEEITPSSKRVLNSLKTLEQLCRLDGYNFEKEIKPILSKVLEDPFWSNKVLSLAPLRSKSKNGEIKFINIASTLRSGETPLTIAEEITPEEVAKRSFKTPFQKDKALSLISKAEEWFRDPADGKAFAENICDLVRDLNKKQKRPKAKEGEELIEQEKQALAKWDLIPSSFGIVERYINWLKDPERDWIQGVYPQRFAIKDKTFNLFLKDLSQKIGYDLFTGRSF